MRSRNLPPFIASPSTAPRQWIRFPAVADQHVLASRHLISKHAASTPSGSVIVLGAGACDEIPLAELAERFDSVALNDLEVDLIESAKASVPDALREKIALDDRDLSGVSDELLAAATEAIAEAADVDVAAEALAAAVGAIQPATVALEERYDYVVASVVLSQLASFALNEIADRCAERFPDADPPLAARAAVVRAVEALSRRLECAFLAQLPHWVRPGGRIFLSATVQFCYAHAVDEREWAADGWYRMTNETDLVQMIPAGLTVLENRRWPWLVGEPVAGQSPARLYNVQGLALAPT